MRRRRYRADDTGFVAPGDKMTRHGIGPARKWSHMSFRTTNEIASQLWDAIDQLNRALVLSGASPRDRITMSEVLEAALLAWHKQSMPAKFHALGRPEVAAYLIAEQRRLSAERSAAADASPE